MTLMQTTQSKETSATRESYLKLRQMILTGALPPGKKLKIEDLRTLLSTGASPVREALSLLTSDMLVERLDQRGFRTAPVSKANFDEILNLRCALEDMALKASLAAADTEWEERVVLCHHRMQRADKQDAQTFEAAHKAFHMALLSNSNQPMLQHYCAQLYDLNIRYRFLAADGPNYRKRSVDAEHEEILNAALDGDADRASSVLVNHYRRTGEYLSTLMDM